MTRRDEEGLYEATLLYEVMNKLMNKVINELNPEVMTGYTWGSACHGTVSREKEHNER